MLLSVFSHWLSTVWLQCVLVWVSLSLFYLEISELLRFIDSSISPNLGSFTIISSNKFSAPFSLYSFSGTLKMYVLITWWCLTDSLCFAHFSPYFFLCVLKTQEFQISYHHAHWFFLLPAQFCCWTFLVNLHFNCTCPV